MIRSIVLVLTVCNLSMAEDMPKEVRVVINEHYIGEWDFEMTTSDGTGKGSYTTRWAPGRHCVLISEESEGPMGEMQGTGVLAWQPDTKHIVHHGFLSNGDYFRITYDKCDGKKWSGRVTGLVNGKRPEESDATAVWKKDGFTYKDNIFHFVAKRKLEPSKEWLHFFEGDWKRKARIWTEADGWTEATEEWSGKMVNGAVVSTGQDSNGVEWVAIDGLDGYRDGILEYGNDTSGTNWSITFTEISKKRIAGETKGRLPDGRKAHGKTVIERKGKNAYIAETVVKTPDGDTVKFIGDNTRR